jgi:Tol biopolymer transport system component/tRNA A-37 threonylcarbamoyl transferase component Bud32
MTMDALARLAPAVADRYRIERELGQGGMATVFLADDLRHGRRVAIKLLHAELSAVLGPERFLAEIKTTAALQHPHILPLFDSGSADGLLYYVMPYVEGETLRHRLERERQLPVADAVRMASEVADALDYAHRHDVVHRDVKPENILLGYPSRDRGSSGAGHALVADFGIALAVQQAGGHRLTQTGLSLGTPHYMAPEQATGERHVDARADVYALGAVTYEMLAGVPPFTGPTAQAIIAKVLTERPRPLRELRDTVPPHIAAAVHSALEKLPADRPADAAVFARQLTQVSAATSALPGVRRARPRSLTWGFAAMVLAVAAGVGYAIGRHQAQARMPSFPPSRLALLTPELEGTGVAGLHRQLALTPNGQSIVFVANSEESGHALAVQRMDATDPALIPGGDGLMDPRPSPDGRWLMVWGSPGSGAREKAFRLPLGGGTAVQLPAGVDPRFAAWSSDGSFWFTTPSSGLLRRLSPDGRVTPVMDDRIAGMRLQQILEPGPWALMVRAALGTISGPVAMINLETGEQATVLDVPVVEARYAAGFLVYAQTDGALMAAPFSPARRQMLGAPLQLGTGVSLAGNGIAQFALASNGTVAYIPEEPRSLVFADRSGAFRLATPEKRNYHAPEFSPDGRRLSIDFTGSEGRDVWLLSLSQGTLSRTTFDRDGHDATWSPDGRYLTYSSVRSGVFGVYRVRAGSAEPPESLLASAKLGYTGRWLPDGEGLIATASDLQPNSGSDVVLVQNGGRGPIKPLVTNQFQTSHGMPSPDGRWFTYVSNQSGEQEVFVRSLAGADEEVQVSQDGGLEPVWSPNGRELFYRGRLGGRTRLMVATLRTTPELEVLSRKPLFSVDDIVGATPHANYSISPDGRTFVMVRRAPANRIMVLQNLPELVRRIRQAEPTTQR